MPSISLFLEESQDRGWPPLHTMGPLVRSRALSWSLCKHCPGAPMGSKVGTGSGPLTPLLHDCGPKKQNQLLPA